MLVVKNNEGKVKRVISFMQDDKSVGKVEKVQDTETLPTIPTNSSISPTSVMFLGLKAGTFGDFEICVSNNSYVLKEKDKVWMTTNIRDIENLSSQFIGVKGDVCVSGLGLGVVTTILNISKDVTSVTVYEISKEVIALYLDTELPKNKVTIVNDSIENATKTYDYLCLDHYNLSDDVEVGMFSHLSPNIRFYGDDYVPANNAVFDVLNTTNSNIKKHIYDVFLSEDIEKLSDLVKENSFDLPYDKTCDVLPYLCIFNLSTNMYDSVQVAWKHENIWYSVKYKDNKITDFYRITNSNECFSEELDLVTKKVKAIYLNKGHDKTSKTGELLQKNIPVSNAYSLPPKELEVLLGTGFPFLDEVVYYSNKPYGNVVEVNLLGVPWI